MIYDIGPSSYFPADQSRTYTLWRRTKPNRQYMSRGPFAGTRATLESTATGSDMGTDVNIEERINLPLDADVSMDDTLIGVEDGQVWSVKSVRRQPEFYVVFVQRSGLDTGTLTGEK